MAISQGRLEELIEVYEEVFGERLTHEEARAVGNRLLTVFRLFMPLRDDHPSLGSLEANEAERAGQDLLLPD